MRILVSYSKPERVEKYRDSLKGVDGFGLEIVDACSRAEAPPTGWSELIASADGLLLTGGSDVEPRRYGEEVEPAAGVETNPVRDAMEWELLAAARAEHRPVLAICRGHQLVNAFLGGTLWQDLGLFDMAVKRRHDPPGAARRDLAHGLDVGPGSDPLSELFRRSAPVEVNSLHHQAVRELGDDLGAVATSPDGVIEAMAFRDPSWWLWSVQWHPEELTQPTDHPVHRELFRRFLAACEEGR
ncbi:MAG TPA: gamma-glutamyl-gamma-aminobutyrate hydrolase family protein [Thermoanaerobaculia bacterium]